MHKFIGVGDAYESSLSISQYYRDTPIMVMNIIIRFLLMKSRTISFINKSQWP